MYLKNFATPAFPEPPKHLVEKDHLVEHIPPEKISVDYTKINQILIDRRSAEVGFATLYSEKLSVEEFNEKLLRKINAFNRYRARVKRLYQSLKGQDGSVAVTSKMLQKDLFVAERSLENIQIENQEFLATIQNYEAKESRHAKELEESERCVEELKYQFQSLAEKFDEKNKMLENSEEKMQNLLLQLEKMSRAEADVSKRTSLYQEEILYLKNQITTSQMRENSLSLLNTELADTLAKTQKKNKELELALLSERREFENRVKHLQNTETLISESEERRAQDLINRTREFEPALDNLADHQWHIKDTVTNQALLNEVYPSIKTEIEAPPEKAPTLINPGSKNLQAFYQKWSHIIDELSSLSGPLQKNTNEGVSGIKELVDFAKLEEQAPKNQHGELGI